MGITVRAGADTFGSYGSSTQTPDTPSYVETKKVANSKGCLKFSSRAKSNLGTEAPDPTALS